MTTTMERVTLDPPTEDAQRVPLELSDPANGILILEHAYPDPPKRPIWAQSADTEGARLVHTSEDNRQLTYRVQIRRTREPATTNLITNPVLQVDAAGWTNTGLAAMARAASPVGHGPYGHYALRCQGNSSGDYASANVAVTNGQPVAAAADVYLDSNGSGAGVRLELRDAGGVLIASSAALTTLDTWTRLTLTGTANATATWTLRLVQTAAGTTDAYVTRAQVEAAATPSELVTGDVAGCDWTGTRHASTSTRPAAADRVDRALADLEEKLEQITRRGGTISRRLISGRTFTFDVVLDEDAVATWDTATYTGRLHTVGFRLVASPYARGPEQIAASASEATVKPLRMIATDVPGDVPALGRLLVDEDQGVDQAWAIWALRQQDYSAAASAALFIQAEDLTTQGGSTKVAGPTGASGSGSNVVRNSDLTTSYVSILSGQLSASSTYLSHIGTHRVFARVYCPTGNTGLVDVALEWAEGDFRRVTRNLRVRYESGWEGSWRLLDLGLASPSAVVQGTQRWEPRVVARSTVVGDEIDIDFLMFVPADEASGEVASTTTLATSTALSARDEFAHAAGNLVGKVMPQGGTWATGTGDTDDYTINTTEGTAQRVTVSDTAPRLVNAGTTTYATIAVQADVRASGAGANGEVVYTGIAARSIDSGDNYIGVRIGWGPSGGVAPTFVELTGNALTSSYGTQSKPEIKQGNWWTIRLLVTAAGAFAAWVFPRGGDAGQPIFVGSDPKLATGGVNATGKIGLLDLGPGASNQGTRSYDNFLAWVPTLDAACFASQSLEIRHDGVIREDSAGSIWTPVSRREGSALLVPPTGRQKRPVEILVAMSRSVPGLGADPLADDLSAELYVTPRYRQIPRT